MNPISYILKDPVRFAKHLRIKFLNKKIKELQELGKYFKGKNGLEIGGPSKIFGKEGYIPIYPLVNSVDGVNFSTTTVWENTITAGKTYNYGGKTYGYQFIQDGTDLSPVDSEHYDFVLSSHSLEHIANPLKALNEWLRVLKKGGILVLVLPDKRYTFDYRRPVTKFEHLQQDFQNETAESDLTHLEEIISLHDLSCDDGIQDFERFKKRSADNFANRCLHHHVFDLKLMEDILEYFNLKIIVKDTAPPYNLIMMAVKEK